MPSTILLPRRGLSAARMPKCDGDADRMKTERRRSGRVEFKHGVTTQMMAIDGTWRRACKLEDVSTTGARLSVQGSIAGLELKEFFLLLSSTGTAYRRCQLQWLKGNEVGLTFLAAPAAKKKGLRKPLQADPGA